MPRSRDEYVLAAIEEAKKSNVRCQHGAVIVNRGKIIARGYNHYIPACFVKKDEKKFDKTQKTTIHAEIDALNRCNQKELRGAKLYVVRLTRGKEQISYSAPCKRCKIILVKMMEEHGLRKVYFTTDD